MIVLYTFCTIQIHRRSYDKAWRIPQRINIQTVNSVRCAHRQFKKRLINNCFADYLWAVCQLHEIAQLLACNEINSTPLGETSARAVISISVPARARPSYVYANSEIVARNNRSFVRLV